MPARLIRAGTESLNPHDGRAGTETKSSSARLLKKKHRKANGKSRSGVLTNPFFAAMVSQAWDTLEPPWAEWRFPMKNIPRHSLSWFSILLSLLFLGACDEKKSQNNNHNNANNSNNPCEPNPCTQERRTRCENQNGQAVCLCDLGTVEIDGACQVVTSCEPNPCTQEHRTQCRIVDGAARCECDPGYVLVGDACETLPLPSCDACDLQCPAHSYCDFRLGRGKVCVCEPGFQDHDRNGTCEPTCATAGLSCESGRICSDRSGTAACVEYVKPPIYIAFHWHMHQPIYWPYESIVQTEQTHQGEMGYSVYDIHYQRSGPYTTWPRDAISAGSGMPHLGAQVSISGSLIENLDNMEAAGAGFSGWKNPWRETRGWRTQNGNPRLDIVNFGYHHPLMGLLDARDVRLQLQLHRRRIEQAFGSADSRGIFPPECAFSKRMIPALAAENIEWSLVDNIHFDRAHRDYPWVPESNLPPPNRADQVNTAATDWVALSGLWAPSRVASPWGYRPHWVEYRNPETCETARIIAVPAARYEGNEDARGGFGALNYDAVLSQHEAYNNDPDHPILIVLHHDGDNYGGGTDSYYHSNFQAFIAWLQANPTRFVATTVQDYLDMFPPDDDDVIHVEDGSWSGADNGDPEFAKWNGRPGADGHSSDRASWAAIIAARNRVLTAEAIEAASSTDDVLYGTGNDTARAWHYLLNGETSCYWYWDGQPTWDSHPARAANLAVAHADAVIARGQDAVGPSLYVPQRVPYNPGLDDQPSDFEVWTLAYDVSGLSRVTLYVRVDEDGVRDWRNDLYAGGTWQTLAMQETAITPRTPVTPQYIARQYSATVTGVRNALVDYFVEAADAGGRITRSDLFHVWVGASSTPSELFTPANPTKDDVITIYWREAGFLHWGVNGWQVPAQVYWPAGTQAFGDGHAVQTPLSGPDSQGRYFVQIGPFSGGDVHQVDFVFFIPPNGWPLHPDGVIPIAP